MGKQDSKGWDRLRLESIQRDGSVCQDCGVFVGAMNSTLPTAHVHHIIPKSEGGPEKLDNLTTLCRSCHNKCHEHGVIPDHENTIQQGHPLDDNPNWQGGRTVSDGYVMVKRPNHPDSHETGYIYEHRLVAENKLDRRLKSNEEVHHRNGKTTDNRPENLEVMTSAEHMRKHHIERDDLRGLEEPNPDVECACGCGETFKKYDEEGRPRRYIQGHNSREQDSPTQSQVLHQLNEEGYATRQELVDAVDSTEFGVASALDVLKKKGLVENSRQGMWKLPDEDAPGQSRQERIESDETIECACGCGETLDRFDKYGREREYLSGHNTPEKPSPVQDSVLKVLQSEGGIVATSTINERVQATDSTKSIGTALRTLREEGVVDDVGYGKWQLADIDCKAGED